MNIDGIFKLIDAGFTADDIKKMYADPQETPKEETPKEETPKEETPKEETPKEEPPKDNSIEQYLKDLDTRLNKVLETVGQIQTDNIDRADSGEPDPTPTIEELVANFTKDM